MGGINTGEKNHWPLLSLFSSLSLLFLYQPKPLTARCFQGPEGLNSLHFTRSLLKLELHSSRILHGEGWISSDSLRVPTAAFAFNQCREARVEIHSASSRRSSPVRAAAWHTIPSTNWWRLSWRPDILPNHCLLEN